MNPEINQIISGNDEKIYYVKNAVPFYISIPNSMKEVTIVINLVDDPDILTTRKTSFKELGNKIIEEYSAFKQNNIAVVTPLLRSEEMEKIKLNSGKEYTDNLKLVLSKIINISYNILKSSGKEIPQQIILNDNETYRSFNELFSKEYKNRIRLAKLDERAPIITQAPNIAPPITPMMEQTAPVSNINIAPVTPPTETLSGTEGINVALENNEELEQTKSKVKTRKLKREPGFVSYVLLGVIVAILSLIGLYLLL